MPSERYEVVMRREGAEVYLYRYGSTPEDATGRAKADYPNLEVVSVRRHEYRLTNLTPEGLLSPASEIVVEELDDSG